MHKRKNAPFISNRTIQMLLIFAIIAIVFSHFNVWMFWWIPFVFMGGSCTWHSNHHDEEEVYGKSKNDDLYDGDYV